MKLTDLFNSDFLNRKITEEQKQKIINHLKPEYTATDLDRVIFNALEDAESLRGMEILDVLDMLQFTDVDDFSDVFDSYSDEEIEIVWKKWNEDLHWLAIVLGHRAFYGEVKMTFDKSSKVLTPKQIKSLIKKTPTYELYLEALKFSRGTLLQIKEVAEKAEDLIFDRSVPKRISDIAYYWNHIAFKILDNEKLKPLFFLNMDITIRGNFEEKFENDSYFGEEELEVFKKLIKSNYGWSIVFKNKYNIENVTKDEISSEFENSTNGYVGKFSGDVVVQYKYSFEMNGLEYSSIETDYIDTNGFW